MMFINHPKRVTGRLFVQYRGTVSLPTGKLIATARLWLSLLGGGGSGGGGIPAGAIGPGVPGLYGERGSPGDTATISITVIPGTTVSVDIGSGGAVKPHKLTTDPNALGLRVFAENGIDGGDTTVTVGGAVISKASGGFAGYGASYWNWMEYQSNWVYQKIGNGGWGIFPEHSNTGAQSAYWRSVNPPGESGYIQATWS